MRPFGTEGPTKLGVARFYQGGVGGPASRLHEVLFRGAIYLPMLASALAYTQLAPAKYEGEPYVALSVGAEMTWTVGLAAVLWVITYFTWTTLRQRRVDRVRFTPDKTEIRIHPGEWWTVLAHGVAFGSGYVLGASNVSFLLVLAVHHEVQYLYFTYAMARRPESFRTVHTAAIDRATKGFDLRDSWEDARGLRELKRTASFLVWPVIGYIGAIVGGWSELEWLAPLGTRRTFLSLLARWTHLDETVVWKLTRGKTDAVESVSNHNFDYRWPERLREHRPRHYGARSV